MRYPYSLAAAKRIAGKGEVPENTGSMRICDRGVRPGVNNSIIFVSEMARSVAFYQDAVGFRLNRELNRSATAIKNDCPSTC